MQDPEGKLVQLIEERKLWETLTSSPAWMNLVTVLQQQTDELQRVIIYNPLTRLDDVYLQEFKKGQLEGRLSITATIETIMSDLEYEINQIKEFLDGPGTESSGRNGAP